MRRLAFPLIFSLLTPVACVTVNVNFPEATVQKATDDYVRELYRSKEKGRAPAPSVAPSSGPQGSFHRSAGALLSALSLESDALAAESELSFKVDTSKSAAIRERLANRLDDVLKYKRAGLLGESTDGELVFRRPDPEKKLLAKAFDFKSIEKLVTEENADRNELYAEIQKANSLPKSRTVDIARSFARSFQAESPSGTWVETSAGKWEQKP